MNCIFKDFQGKSTKGNYGPRQQPENVLHHKLRKGNGYAVSFITLYVADRNGHFYYNKENGFCVDCCIIQELPDGEYTPETALLRFWDIE